MVSREAACMWSLYALYRSVTTAGRKPRAVNAADSFTRTPWEARYLHLSTTFDAHQKLATLSSNRPRLNGKMRVIGSRMPDTGASGGRNGRKSTTNEATVTKAKRMNSRVLC